VAKNYADIYSSSNDVLALEQRWYAKAESERGVLSVPANGDFFWTLGGGSISYSQAFESSPHRSGRHHTDIIKKKKETSFSFSTYFNIDESLGAASSSQIDAANRLFFKSLLGKEVTSPNLKYTAETAPDVTFSLFECGDKWARQSPGAFIQGGNMSFPGDGEAKVEWSGAAKEAFFVGIGKSTVDNEGGNTVTLQAGEGDAFRVGAAVMLVKADGVTRSSDTPAGSARMVTGIAGDVITLSGTALADADGSAAAVYLSYYEPAAPSAINNPVTGLVGSMTIASLDVSAFRSATVNIQNNHEVVNYSFGTDGLASPYFVPGSRLTATVTVECNLNAETIRLFNRIQDFEAQDLQIVLGQAAGRHLEVACPSVKFKVPAFSLPDTGSVPVSFEGDAYQSAVDAADEIAVEFK
jgi:hypothetical protein